MARLLVLLLGTLLLSACATDRPLETGCVRLHEFETVEAVPDVSLAVTTVTVAARQPDFADAFAPAFAGPPQAGFAVEQPRWADALILSGGGAWGAYGAGYLHGWSAHGRPPPRVVTGISTGALQATFAYLGRDYDDRLLRAYAIERENQLVRNHGSLFFLSHASVADTAPLKQYVMEQVGPLLDAVAAKAAPPDAPGLFVGAVNARTGRFSIFNLGRMASTLRGAERLDCYTAALLASAAVPIIFRQATINRDPWLDGGVRYAMFLPSMVQAVAAGKARAQAEGAAIATTGAVYAIKNGTLLPEPATKAELAPKLLPTLQRLRSITFNGVERDSLALAAVEADRDGLTLLYTTADGWHDSSSPDQCRQLSVEVAGELFNPAFMRCLTAYGEARWAGGADPWITYTRP